MYSSCRRLPVQRILQAQAPTAGPHFRSGWLRKIRRQADGNLPLLIQSQVDASSTESLIGPGAALDGPAGQVQPGPFTPFAYFPFSFVRVPHRDLTGSFNRLIVSPDSWRNNLFVLFSPCPVPYQGEKGEINKLFFVYSLEYAKVRFKITVSVLRCPDVPPRNEII